MNCFALLSHIEDEELCGKFYLLSLLEKQNAMHLPVFYIFFVFSVIWENLEIRKHFTDHRRPDAIHDFRYLRSTLHTFSSKRCKWLQWVNENKPLQRPFKHILHYIYLFELYSILIILLLTNICGRSRSS